ARRCAIGLAEEGAIASQEGFGWANCEAPRVGRPKGRHPPPHVEVQYLALPRSHGRTTAGNQDTPSAVLMGRSWWEEVNLIVESAFGWCTFSRVRAGPRERGSGPRSPTSTACPRNNLVRGRLLRRPASSHFGQDLDRLSQSERRPLPCTPPPLRHNSRSFSH